MVILYRVITLILILASAGCAFTDIPLDMPNSRLEAPISGGNNRSIIVIQPFSDNRSDTSRCGMKKNGYNMDTANAVCKTTPEEWLAQQLTDELRASGFNVVTEKPSVKTNALILRGSISKLFIEPVLGFWSGSLETDIQVKLTASSNNGLFGERTFFVKGVKKGVIISTSSPYKTSLKRAADEILTKMVEAVHALMNQYPSIGKSDLTLGKVEYLNKRTN